MPRETKAEREARFWAKVDKSAGPEGCWPWIGERRSETSQYGRFYLAPHRRAKRIGAHRFACSLAIGRELRADEVPLHSCDNPPCCNPAHLTPGPQLRNVRDMIAKGRAGWQRLNNSPVDEPKVPLDPEPQCGNIGGQVGSGDFNEGL
jgi:hypothetical protein